MDLFNVERDFIGKLDTKPRKATDAECRAYLQWQRARLGLIDFEHMGLEWGGGYQRGQDNRVCIGATFGQLIERGGWQGNEYKPATYENGSYSLLMPGYNRQAATVTMETLNDAGEVVASQTLPVEPKKGGVVWTKEAVRAAAGPVAKVKAAKAPKVASKPAGKAKRTPAHVRAIKLAWAMRKERNRQAAIAHDRLKQLVEASRRGDPYDYAPMANRALFDLGREKAKRRRAVLLARDLQKRLGAEYRLVDQYIAKLREAREWAALLEAENLQLTQAKPRLRLVA